MKETMKSITINGKTLTPKTCPICKSESYIHVEKANDCWGQGMFIPTTWVKVACGTCGCGTPEFHKMGQSEEVLNSLCTEVLDAWNNRA